MGLFVLFYVLSSGKVLLSCALLTTRGNCAFIFKCEFSFLYFLMQTSDKCLCNFVQFSFVECEAVDDSDSFLFRNKLLFFFKRNYIYLSEEFNKQKLTQLN